MSQQPSGTNIYGLSALENNSWLEVNGQKMPALEKELRAAAGEHLKAKKYTHKDVEYVATLERPIFRGSLKLNASELEKLRALCQLWEVRLKPQKISSHRPVIGHVIVAFKKLIYPIFEVFMKDTLRQQRDFNAAAVALLTELTSRTSRN